MLSSQCSWSWHVRQARGSVTREDADSALARLFRSRAEQGDAVAQTRHFVIFAFTRFLAEGGTL